MQTSQKFLNTGPMYVGIQVHFKRTSPVRTFFTDFSATLVTSNCDIVFS